MIILFWIIVLTWMVKTAATDVIASVRGDVPPRHQIRLARINAGQAAQRYGVGGWFADLLEDALRAQTNHRRTKIAEKARAKVAEIDDMVDAAGVRPAASRRPVAPAVPVREPGSGARVAAPVTIPDPDPVAPPVTDPAAPKYPVPAPTSSASPSARPTAAGETRPPAARPLRLVTSTDQDQQGPPSAPIPPESNNQEEPMTAPTNTNTPTVEVTGLASAIAHAEAVAAAHRQHSTAGGESYINSLKSFNVTGTTIDLVAQAQEASANAGALWAQVAAKLGGQTVVKEAYNTNPDAGNQTFVQGE